MISSQLVCSSLGPGWISSSVVKNRKKRQPHEEDGSEEQIPEEVSRRDRQPP